MFAPQQLPRLIRRAVVPTVLAAALLGTAVSATVDITPFAEVDQPAERLGSAVQLVDTEEPVEAQLVDQLNDLRQQYRLGALTVDPALSLVALDHARYLASIGRLSHVGSGGSSTTDRINASGVWWSALGENIALGQASASETLRQWRDSPPHRDNLLGATFNKVGVARAIATNGTPFWVIVFVAG